MIAAIAFWLSLGFVFFTYAVYPAAVIAWARRRGRPARPDPDHLPTVSVCVACRNEARTLGAKLDDVLASDYPSDRLELVVALDGCTDGTAEVARAVPGVTVVELPPGGKPTALNAAVEAATGEILVFMDARQSVTVGSVRALVATLGDPEVGAASGDYLQSEDRGDGESQAVGLYWRYERAIRAAEAALHSTVGATGALWAVRRELWRPLPAETLLDDVVGPMQVVLQGKRVVVQPEALAVDRPAAGATDEFRRKVRTLAGNYQAFFGDRRYWSPWRNPVFLPMLLHKIARLAVPWALLVMLVAAWRAPGVLYDVLLVGQVAFYGAAVAGWGLAGTRRRNRWLHVPYVFCVLNLAAVVGGWRWLARRQAVTWR